ncbi:hypothetical protein [Synechococcus sp. BA-132 BA5]|uniref:hypothetical protein n=1 Tax=Synechococcus sp. BA-132 BA5 TaxID=3110252 RepID=UPI002B20183B|nr:hypothetical protein [Synechococcus sp. BA-132 BA5]MEA5413890.1 hypothetical protein [Synechococcus sp. BA-132 BA5]
MDRKTRSKGHQVQANYALRKPKASQLEQTILKPIVGRTKGARGLDRFQLRRMEKVSGEWHLIATTYNTLKMFRAELTAS